MIVVPVQIQTPAPPLAPLIPSINVHAISSIVRGACVMCLKDYLL